MALIFASGGLRLNNSFELESTPEVQRGKLLLLSMDGKAFSWQRHYRIKLISRIKSWNKFSRMWHADLMIVYEDPIAELSRLKQEGELGEYMEAFDSLLAQVAVSESMAFKFFSVRIKN